VYTYSRKSMRGGAKVTPLIEENPKWSELLELLKEIKEARDDVCEKFKKDENMEPGPIVVIGRDDRVAHQLSECIRENPKKMLMKYWKSYLNTIVEQLKGRNNYMNRAWTTEMQCLQQELIKVEKAEKAKRLGIANLRQRLISEPVAKARPPHEPDTGPSIEEIAVVAEEENLAQVKEEGIMDEFFELKLGGPGSVFRALDPMNQVVVLSGQKNPMQLVYELQPMFVVLSDPTVVLVRQLEVYRSRNPGRPLRVYVLQYELEAQVYADSMQSENKAFEELIKEKQHLSLPKYYEAQENDIQMNNQLLMAATGSRRDARRKKQSQVIVDIREFRSSLPMSLYQKGIKIIPVTLEVGDYVISPKLCIERKAIPDLIHSLGNGRLYSQCESMKRHYGSPILLIEFDVKKGFFLQHPNVLPSQIDPNNVISRLSLLLLHFPQIRIIWSRTATCTSSMIVMLKEKRNEPDVDEAAIIGTGNQSDTKNFTPQDMLRRLPGVSARNLRSILQKVKTVRELCEKSESELQDIMGVTSGKQLYDFIHQSFLERNLDG